MSKKELIKENTKQAIIISLLVFISIAPLYAQFESVDQGVSGSTAYNNVITALKFAIGAAAVIGIGRLVLNLISKLSQEGRDEDDGGKEANKHLQTFFFKFVIIAAVASGVISSITWVFTLFKTD